MPQLKVRDFKNRNSAQFEILKLNPVGHIMSVRRLKDDAIFSVHGIYGTGTVMEGCEMNAFCSDLINVWIKIFNFKNSKKLFDGKIPINDVKISPNSIALMNPKTVFKKKDDATT